jgi:hypothetical protein
VTLIDDIDRRVEEEPTLVGVHGGIGVVAIQQRSIRKIMLK